jgi:dihydroorotate dehydrogenase
MYPIIRRYLFKLEPERAHALTLGALGLAGNIAPARWLLHLALASPQRPVKAFGLTFRNPIGLAAGYDKDARAVRGLAALGFGHIEGSHALPQRRPSASVPSVGMRP